MKKYIRIFVIGFFLFTHTLTFAGSYHAIVIKAWQHKNCKYVIYDIYYHKGNNVTWDPHDPGWVHIGTQTAEFCSIVIPDNPFTPPDSAGNRGYWPFDFQGLNLSEFPPYTRLDFSSVVMAPDSQAKVLLPAQSGRWFISFYDNMEGKPIYEENINNPPGYIILPRSYAYVMARRAYIVIVLLDRNSDILYLLHD